MDVKVGLLMVFYIIHEPTIIIDKDEEYKSIVRGVYEDFDERNCIAYSERLNYIRSYIRERVSLQARLGRDCKIAKIDSPDDITMSHTMWNMHRIRVHQSDKIQHKISHDDKVEIYMTDVELMNVKLFSSQYYKYREAFLRALMRTLVLSRYIRYIEDSEYLYNYLRYILYKYIKPLVYESVNNAECWFDLVPVDLIKWIDIIGGPDYLDYDVPF